jgi:lipopolysaccharide biosynthesis glycosyltransferase
MTPGEALSAARPIPHHAAPGERFAGAADYLDPAVGLRGWVVDVEAPGRPAHLGIRCRGEILATSWAMMDRPDIDAMLGRLTQCGFLVSWARFELAALARVAEAAPDSPLEVVVLATGRPVEVTWGGLSAGRALALVRATDRILREPSLREVDEYCELAESGLFDPDWYEARQATGLPPGMPPLLHYMRHGEPAGLRPNFLFDPARYARLARRRGRAGALLHYVRTGAAAGLPPGPHFDGAWYAARHSTAAGVPALAHYLAHRNRHAPNRWFDVGYYLDAIGAGPLADPFEHFVRVGFPAGLTPCPDPPPEAQGWIAELQREASRDDADPEPETTGLQGAPAYAWLRSSEAVPPAVALGFTATEATLREAGAERCAAVESAAAARLGVRPDPDAALSLVVLRELAGDRAGALAAAAAFLDMPAVGTEEAEADIAGQLLAMANALHEERRAPEAERVYHLLYARGRRDWLLLLRLLQIAIDRRDAAAAGLIAAELEGTRPPRPTAWGVVALAHYDLMRGERGAARARLHRMPPYPATDAAGEAGILNALIEVDGPEAAAMRAAHSAEAEGQEIYGAHLRIALKRLDIETVRRLLGDPRAERLPGWQLAEAIYLIGAPGRLPLSVQDGVMAQLTPLAEAHGLGEPTLVQARAQYLLQVKRWDELGQLLDAIDGTPLAGQREMLLRRLEYYCGIGDFDAAGRLFDAQFRAGTLTKWEGLTVMRLLSEVGRWADAAEVLMAHLRQGQDLGGAAHLGLRIVRRAAMHAAVLALRPPAGGEPRLGAFLGFVAEDLALRRAAEAAQTDGPVSAGGRGLQALCGGPAAPRQGEKAEEHCILLCTNRRYFLSLLTFLASFLSQPAQAGSRIFIFLDNDVPGDWQQAIAALGDRFGRALEMVTEDAFLEDAVEHRVAYGFFTGGSTLARSAYFRLYAVRWLLARHRFQRALYIDTDTICRGDLSGLFELDLGDRLIAAAIEDLAPEVLVACARNGLHHRDYFNSGVLLLRMEDPALPGVIEEAIRIAEREPERLVFHDQCALNIAFSGRVASLPTAYNFYLRPARERNGYLEDAVILHFLDTPKPWDIAFDRGYREEWRVWAVLVGTLLPKGLTVAMLAAANET